MLSQNQAFLFAHWSWHDNSCSILASRIVLHICLGYGTTVQGNLHGRGRGSAKYLEKFAFPTWIEWRLLQTGLEDLNLRFFEGLTGMGLVQLALGCEITWTCCLCKYYWRVIRSCVSSLQISWNLSLHSEFIHNRGFLVVAKGCPLLKSPKATMQKRNWWGFVRNLGDNAAGCLKGIDLIPWYADTRSSQLYSSELYITGILPHGLLSLHFITWSLTVIASWE